MEDYKQCFNREKRPAKNESTNLDAKIILLNDSFGFNLIVFDLDVNFK